MDPKSLVTLGDEHLELARSAHSGRSSLTVYGDHTHALRQTLIALVSGQSLAEHENPGEATVQVLRGSITLIDSESVQPASDSELLAVPLGRHSLRAETDCVVLLTVAVDLG